MKTEEELQSYFIKRIEKFVNAKGRKLIGWDEILEGGLAPNAAVMSWRGTEGGIAAARAGHDVVMTPTSHCYFDYYQGPPAYEPPAIGGFLPVAKVYGFEPMPSELNAEEAAHIRGVQANLWTEYIPSSAHAEYMILPRLAAIAEVGWSASNSRDWKDFAARLAAQFERYDAAGIRFSTTAYNVRIAPKLDSRTRELAVALENEIGSGEIRFTLDGRDPTPTSALYDRPFRLKKSSIVKASTFAAGQPVGQVTRTDFIAHLALGKTPKLAFSYQQRYSGGGDMGLVDGLRGSKAHGDGLWQGFEQDDLVAELDLGKPHNIKKITTGFLRSINSWIFFPRSVEYAVSADGKDYRLVATIMNDASDQDPDILIKDFSAALVGVRARFVRVRAKNIGLCPEGHPGAGDKAWLFVDEIIVE